MEKKNVVKKLTTILFTLVAVFAVGLTNVNAKTVTVENEEQLINASKGIDSEISEIKLAKDITLTKYLNFYVVNDITLELNGQTLDTGSEGLSFNYGQSAYDELNNKYYYGFNSKLTIKDSGSSKTGKILTKKSINFTTYDVTHDEQIKKFGLTIEGGYYEIISSTTTFISLFTNDYYTNGKNITVDVKVKDAVFNIGDQKSLFGTSSDSDSDIKFNFNFESLKAMGLASKLGSNKLGEMKLDNVIDPNSKAYFQELPYTTGAPVLTEANRNTLVEDFYSSGGENPYIIIKKVNGFEVNNVEINETYKETPSLNSISIKNISGSDLQIKNVTVVGSDNFTIEGPSTSPTVSAGATNIDYKIKAKEGLPVGTYTATITVTDSNGNYTATVALKVEKKNLTVGINGLDSTLVYGTTKTPTATGVDDLGADDYKITYSKLNNGSYEDIGTTLPKLVGEYRATLSITNPNYTATDFSKDFVITPITTEVKIKSYDETFTYDGTEHTKNAYVVLWANNASPVTDNKLPNGDIVSAVITGKVKDVKDTKLENNTIESYKIINSEGVDVTNCYSNIVTSAGKLTVNPIAKSIVVTAGTSTKDYDGTPLTNNTYTYTEDVLLDGDVLKATVTGSQLFVGNISNELSDVKVMRGEEEITSNYTFGTHVNGMLTVMGASQPIMVADQSLIVNGFISLEDLKQMVTGNIGNIDITLKSGDALTYDAINEGYKAVKEGTVTMTVTAVKVNLGGDDTPEWIETSKDFKINVVNKENVTISGLNDNEEFTYDGTPKKPSGTIKVDGDKVPVNDLEVKYTNASYDSTEAPKNAGTYMVTYKVKDDNAKYVGSVTYTFTIKKASLDKVTLVNDTFEYTGEDITPSLNNVNENIKISGVTTAKDVSTNIMYAELKDTANYEWKDFTNNTIILSWTINQATPSFTVPTGLTGIKGQTLNDITLPGRFIWNNTSTVLTAGTHTYKATYTPEDTTNYKTITDIDIEVYVKDKFDVITSVNGGNGNITPSKIGAIENTKFEITFTPDEGYMIDKVLVNTVETTITGNKLELTVDEEKEVEVTYKKIPFTVTVKDVEGATITPNGAVSVNYGDTREFTITANSGYKLVKVLVDEVDKTSDMTGDTLKLTNITSNINVDVVVEKIVYEVTEGANQEYTITKDSEAKFKINADFRMFDGGKVYVDDELVDPNNYTAESGSTIITLKKEYVDKLSIGKHTLKVVFSDGGQATTIFNVAKTTVPVENPNTLDNVMIYIVSGILSIIGITGTITFYKRKQKN